MRSLSNHHETAVSLRFDIAHKIGGLTLITITDHTCLARINIGFWENTHLPLLQANINAYFSFRAKCWLKGGVGEQFPRNLNWSLSKDPNRALCPRTKCERCHWYTVTFNTKTDLVTVFDAILTSRQTRENLQCLYENLMSNNFRKTAVLKKISTVK